MAGIGANVAGSYELQTINGQGLPFTSDDGFVTVYTGVLELDNNGRFVDLLQVRTLDDPRIRDDERRGTWDQSANDIRLDYDNSTDVFFATRPSNGRLVVEDDAGNTLEYRRF